MLDSLVYIMEFSDGDTQKVSYNTFAENLFSQVDSKGDQYQIFCEIINVHKKRGAMDKSDQYRC